MSVLPTPAGQASEARSDTGLIEAINQVFELFRINYHNQFHKAYGNQEENLVTAKRLWLETLRHLPAATILRGAKRAIEESEYLPTLHAMLRFCASETLPKPYEAYLEACNAPSPKAAQLWSHPAVYHAGKATGWYSLASTEERFIRPSFEQHYQYFCDKVLKGETLEKPSPPAIEQQPQASLGTAESAEKLSQLKNLFED